MISGQNHTAVTRFILLGLTDQADQKQLLFAVFLMICTVTLAGTLGMIDLIRASSVLHTPMYFFLGVTHMQNLRTKTDEHRGRERKIR